MIKKVWPCVTYVVPFAAGQPDREGAGAAEELEVEIVTLVEAVGDPDAESWELAGIVRLALDNIVADTVAFVNVGRPLEGPAMGATVTVVTPEVTVTVLMSSAWSWPDMVRVCNMRLS